MDILLAQKIILDSAERTLDRSNLDLNNTLMEIGIDTPDLLQRFQVELVRSIDLAATEDLLEVESVPPVMVIKLVQSAPGLTFQQLGAHLVTLIDNLSADALELPEAAEWDDFPAEAAGDPTKTGDPD